MSIVVQPYQPDMRDTLLAFHERSFPQRDMGTYERVWRWQYFDNPHEPAGARRIWVVTRQSKIIAHLGTMAARVKLNGETLCGRWSSDLMVDEGYRDGGLGVWLIREWLKSCELALAKGLSPEVTRVYERLGWHRVPLRPVAQLPLTLRCLTGRLTRNRPVNATAEGATRWARRAWTNLRHSRAAGLEFRTVEAFPQETDELMERVAGRSGMSILRDRCFLQWRYGDCPARRHVIETAWRDQLLRGFAVFSVRPERGFRRGIIHDLEIDAEDGDALHGLLVQSLKHMHDARADEVAVLPRTEAEQSVLASLGFVFRKPPHMMMHDVQYPGRNLAALTTNANVQLGDGDDW